MEAKKIQETKLCEFKSSRLQKHSKVIKKTCKWLRRHDMF